MENDFILNHDYFDTLDNAPAKDEAFEENIDLLDKIEKELAEANNE